MLSLSMEVGDYYRHYVEMSKLQQWMVRLLKIHKLCLETIQRYLSNRF